MQIIGVIICASLLCQGTYGDIWQRMRNEVVRATHRVGNAVQTAVDQTGAELNRFGDRLAPDIENVKEELERFGDRLAPDVQNVADFIRGKRTDINDPDGGGQALSIPDPPPGATKCSPIIEPSLELDCHFEGASVNCSEPMAVGTVAYMKCQEAYVFLVYPGYNFVTCNASYFWSDPIITCIADCGKRSNVGGRQLVSNGERAEVSEFSWHVGIYKLNRTNHYVQICGGTLLTRSLVITAAHCFWDNNRDRAQDISLYAIAAGKYHREWYIEDEETQKKNIQDLYIHERFNGVKRNLAYDIAIIRVAEDFRLTWAINTICMDYPRAFEELHLRTGNNGTIAGWGITENNTQSDVLMSVQLPFIDYLACGDIVHVSFQKYLTDDKICGGYVNRNTAVCPGDSGGGYVFPQETVRGRRYFLRGIVSAGHMPYELSRRCETQQVSAFTLVSKHRAFIEKHVFRKKKVA